MVCVVLVVSLSKKIHHSEGTYQILCGIFGVLIVAFLIFGMFHVYENDDQMEFLARSFLIAWLVSYFVPLFYSLETLKKFCRYIGGLIVLTFLAPTFFNIIALYSIANINDVTWGRGTMPPSQSALKLQYQQFDKYRTNCVIAYLIVNYAFFEFLHWTSQGSQETFLLAMALFLGSLLWVRILFSLINRIVLACKSCSLDRYIKR